MPSDFRRLLAMRLDNIGDVVMLGPSLRALRQGYPAAHITLMASPAGSQAAELLPWIDDVLSVRTLWQDASGALAFDPARELDLVARLRDGGYDAAFIFTSFSQTPFPAAYACYLAGIPVRVGQAGEFGGGVLSHQVSPLPREAHQVDRNLHLLEGFGLSPGDPRLELWLGPNHRSAARSLLASAGLDLRRSFVALAPTASCPARTYDSRRFAEAMRMVLDHTGSQLVLLGSAREAASLDAIQASLPGLPVVSLAGETSVPVLAAIIGAAALLITNDSGPMHLADALCRPMVVLFSGTDLESQWRPRSAPAVLLRRDTACSPCYHLRCPYHLECLDISPEEVAVACIGQMAAGAGALAP